MSLIVDTTDTVWRNPFPFLCLLSVALIQARHHTQQVALVQANRHTKVNIRTAGCTHRHYPKTEPKENRPYSYKPITIMQNADRT